MAKMNFKAFVLLLFSASLSGQNTADTSYYASGRIWTITRYKDGKKNGPFLTYHESGNFRQVAFFKDGRKEGTETFYFANGNPEMQTDYQHGVRNGTTTIYYPNGTKMFCGGFKQGYMSGERMYYNADGSPANGKFTAYRENGSLERQCECIQGKPEGELLYYSNGTLSLRSHYKKGKAHGPAIHYNGNNTVNYIDYYFDGDYVSEAEYRKKTGSDPFDHPDKKKWIRPLPAFDPAEQK